MPPKKQRQQQQSKQTSPSRAQTKPTTDPLTVVSLADSVKNIKYDEDEKKVAPSMSWAEIANVTKPQLPSTVVAQPQQRTFTKQSLAKLFQTMPTSKEGFIQKLIKNSSSYKKHIMKHLKTGDSYGAAVKKHDHGLFSESHFAGYNAFINWAANQIEQLHNNENYAQEISDTNFKMVIPLANAGQNLNKRSIPLNNVVLIVETSEAGLYLKTGYPIQ